MPTSNICATPIRPRRPVRPDLAKLFRQFANIEANEHFDREAQAAKLGSTNGANLEDAMAGEHYENVTMYIDFARQAEADGDTRVAAMFRQIAVDEGAHYDAYKAALAKLSPRRASARRRPVLPPAGRRRMAPGV